MDALGVGEPNLITRLPLRERIQEENVENSASNKSKFGCLSEECRLSSTWILLTKEEHHELLDFEDAGALLPTNECNLILSKPYAVNMHVTPSIVDHYSKEINKLVDKEVCVSGRNKSVIVAQILCLPKGSTVVLHIVNDDRYNSWLASKSRLSLFIQPDMEEMVFGLQHMKDVIIQSEESVRDCLVKYIKWNASDCKQIEDALNVYIAKLDCASQYTESITSDIITKQMNESANYRKEALISISTIVRCNNLLITENAELSNKYEKIQSHMQQGDCNLTNDLAQFKEDFLSRSNERLCSKLSAMQNAMQDLVLKLQKAEKNNAVQSEQMLKLRLEQEQQKLKFNQATSSSNIEKAQMKKEISEKTHIIEQATNAGKSLIEDIKTMENILKDMGKDVDFKEGDVCFSENEALQKVMNVCRHCINEFSRTILAVHSRAEAAEQYSNHLKNEFANVSDQAVNLNNDISQLNAQLVSTQKDRIHLLQQISELKEENSLIQEQLSQSNYRNLLLHNELSEIRKQCSDEEIDQEFKKSVNSDEDLFKDCTDELKTRLNELINEKHLLLDRIHESELALRNAKESLEKKEELLEETRRNYHSYILMVKQESEERITELTNSQELLMENYRTVKNENAILLAQIETLKKENSSLQNNETRLASDEIDSLKNVIERLNKLLECEKSENVVMKMKLEQISNVQNLFNSEEINFDSEVENLKENYFNEGLIKELRQQLIDKDNTIQILLTESQTEMSEFERFKNESQKLKKELIFSKRALDDYNEDITDVQGGSNQKLYKSLHKKSVRCEQLTKECYHKSLEITKLKYSLKDLEKKYKAYREQITADVEGMEKELIVAKKQLSAYEGHILSLDKEIKKQVKLVEDTKQKLTMQENIKVGTYDIEKLLEKLNEKEKDLFNLRERLKNYCDYCTNAQQSVNKWKIKYEVLEQCVLEKDNVIHSLENDKKIIEEMSLTYNKLSSSLAEEQRKVIQLEGQLKTLESVKRYLEKQLDEKELLLRDSLSDLQKHKEEVVSLNSIFTKDSERFMLLEKKYVEEKAIIEKDYKALEQDKNDLQKEYDTICDKLVNALQMLMQNKCDNEQMEAEIKDLSGILEQKEKVKKSKRSPVKS